MKKSFWKTFLYYIIILGLAALLIFLIRKDNMLRQESALRIVRFAELAEPYEKEISKLKQEMKKKEMELAEAEKAEKGTAVLAFQPSLPDDISFVREMAERYQFQPVIILDCGKTEEVSTGFIEDISKNIPYAAYGLTGSPFTEEIADTADRVIKKIRDFDQDAAIAFLFDYEEDTPGNERLFSDRGFDGFLIYSESYEKGVTAEEIPYLGYSSFTTSMVAVGPYLSGIGKTKSPHLLYLKLEGMADNQIWQENAAEWVKMVFDYQKIYASLEVESMGAAFQDIVERETEARKNRMDYEKYQAEVETRIEELRKLIRQADTEGDED